MEARDSLEQEGQLYWKTFTDLYNQRLSSLTKGVPEVPGLEAVPGIGYPVRIRLLEVAFHPAQQDANISRSMKTLLPPDEPAAGSHFIRK